MKRQDMINELEHLHWELKNFRGTVLAIIKALKKEEQNEKKIRDR